MACMRVFSLRKVPKKDRASLGAQLVKNLPAMQETWIGSLAWEDPLEKEMASHSVFLPERISWTEEPGGLESMELQRVEHDLATKLPPPPLQRINPRRSGLVKQLLAKIWGRFSM